MKFWSRFHKKYSTPTGDVATRYSITHTLGQPQKLTLWGTDHSLTLEIPDSMAQNISAGLTLGVIDNRRMKRMK